MIDKLPVINVTNVDRPLLQLLVDEVQLLHLHVDHSYHVWNCCLTPAIAQFATPESPLKLQLVSSCEIGAKPPLVHQTLNHELHTYHVFYKNLANL